jgi:UDP-glucose 4-epimerase
MARYVVTGGTGFIGAALVERIQAAGDQAIVASRHRDQRLLNCDWVEYDLRDVGTVANILEARPDGIFHLAWSTTPASAERDVTADVEHNLRGSVALFERLSGEFLGPLIFASSGGTVYGHPETLPIPETHPLRPISYYGQSKATVEAYARLFRARRGLDARVARVSNPFGATQPSAKLQGAATIFARQIMAGHTITIWGDGSVVRDYIHVADAADALHAICRLPPASTQTLPVYNVGSGQGLMLVELINLIADVASRLPNITYENERGFDVPANVLDITRLSQEAGWRAQGVTRNSISELIARISQH